jgi:DNA-binding NarL/FixJ family response regulator
MTHSLVVTCAHCGNPVDLAQTPVIGTATSGMVDAETRATLRPREREVLDLVARGWRVARIAESLQIADGTVRKHLQSVYRAVGVGSKAELVELLHGSPVPSATGQTS